MGTPGTVGVISKGIRKSAYQQYDSYPSGVGVKFLEFARQVAADPVLFMRVIELADELKLVDENARPTADDLKLIGSSYLDSSVSEGDDWYAYLRQTQGYIQRVLDSGYACGGEFFGKDWGYHYILNLDDLTITAYEGANVISSYGFDSLPTNDEMAALD